MVTFGEGSDSQTTSLTRKMQLVKNEAGICEEKALPSLPLQDDSNTVEPPRFHA
jgi:hypothetical protein